MRFTKLAIGLAAALVVAGSSAQAATLQDAVKQTIESNPEILAASSQRQARDQEVRQARGGYYPSVDVNAGFGRQGSKNNNTGFEKEWKWAKEAGVLGRQMLFDGFATRSEVERQSARVNSQAYRLNGLSENLAAQAAEVYLNVLRRQGQLQYAKENLETHQRIYDQIKLRHESGIAKTADLAQISGRLALAETNVVTEEVNLRDAETNYLKVVGVMPDALEEPASVKDQLPATVDEATEKALQTNATLQSAREDVEAAFAQRDAAKNTYYPHINLELHRSWDRDNNGIDGEDHDTSAFVRMRYNIYNGGSDKARVRETADLINEAKDIRNNTHRELVESMRLAWTAYQAAELQREYLEQHVVDTRQTRDAYLKQFNIGQRTLLDVLDTENELFDAKKAALDSHYDGVIGQYRVLRAMSMVAEVVDVELPKETTPIPSPRQERLAGSPEEE